MESEAFIVFQFSSVRSLSHVRLFATPWTSACQASLSITNSWNLLKFMSVASVMPSNHLTLCRPLLLLPLIFPSIRVFPTESVLRISWPKEKKKMETPFQTPTVPIKTGLSCSLEESACKHSCLWLPGKGCLTRFGEHTMHLIALELVREFKAN